MFLQNTDCFSTKYDLPIKVKIDLSLKKIFNTVNINVCIVFIIFKFNFVNLVT